MSKQKWVQKNLRKELYLDPLTNLYNRRVLKDLLIDKVQSMVMAGHMTAMIGLDANKFKQINDSYGHQKGDEALCHIANCMRKCTRSFDYCIRIGGDEFLIIAFDINHGDMQSIIQRLDEYIAMTSVQEIGIEVHATVVGSLIYSDENFDQAFKRVDDLLYANKKRNGKSGSVGMASPTGFEPVSKT
ncbi:MAG: GGDEF domain-containing protein [Vibrio sp.]